MFKIRYPIIKTKEIIEIISAKFPDLNSQLVCPPGPNTPLCVPFHQNPLRFVNILSNNGFLLRPYILKLYIFFAGLIMDCFGG